MEIMTTPAVHHNDSYKDEGFDHWDRILISINIMSVVIYSVVFVLGVLGNGVVIWATGFKMKKTVSTVWYLNLAAADFLVTAFLPVRITWRALNGHWPFGWFMCKMNSMVNMYASIFTLVVISVDRCVCVLCPVWSRNHRTVRKASWVSVGVWVLALAPSIPGFVFRDTLRQSDKVKCYMNFALVADYSRRTPEEEQLHAFRLWAMAITRFVVGFVVPLSVIVSCYSVIIYRLRNNRSLASQSGRSFKIIATVIATFFLSWAPFHILSLIGVVVTEISDTVRLVMGDLGFPITLTLALVNSCLNPLLYVFLGQGFKDVFRRSILKVLEKAFAEELPLTDTRTDPAVTRQTIALSEIEGIVCPEPKTRQATALSETLV